MQLTENMVVARSKDSDLSSIRRINFWGCDLQDISIVRKMNNVEALALSANKISCLEPLANCKKLQELYLRQNNIQDFSQLKHLQNLPALSHLWLSENPCSINAGPDYRACVVKMLPNLEMLDGEMITKENIEMAKKLDSLPLESAQLDEDQAEVKNSAETLAPQSSAQLSAEFDAEQKPQQESQLISPNNTQHCAELQSPNELVLSNNSNRSDHAAATSEANCTVPLNFTVRIDYNQPAQTAVQTLDTTRSLSQIPQINLVVQICQSPSVLEPPNQIPQTVRERSDDDQFYRCEAAEDQTACRNYQRSNMLDDNFPAEQPFDSSAENISHCSTETLSQGHQNATQTPRSTYSMGTNCNSYDNLRGAGDFSTHQNSARSSFTLANGSRNNNILDALFCIVPELDRQSLEVLRHSLLSRLEELSVE